MFPIPVPAAFSVIAHRGASGYAPENTMEAFVLARRMGAREMEFDCQLSSDGAVVICHDFTLERFGHPGCVVADMPAGQLCRLDMGSWMSPFLHSSARMPLLGEVLNAFGAEMTYHVELKSAQPQLADAVVEEIAGRNLADHCVILSFHQAALARVRDIHETMRLAWDVERLDARELSLARELDLAALNPAVTAVTAEAVRQAHEIVEEVLVWGIDGDPAQVREQLLRAVTAGCDGAFLNWPDRALPSGV